MGHLPGPVSSPGVLVCNPEGHARYCSGAVEKRRSVPWRHSISIVPDLAAVLPNRYRAGLSERRSGVGTPLARLDDCGDRAQNETALVAVGPDVEPTSLDSPRANRAVTFESLATPLLQPCHPGQPQAAARRAAGQYFTHRAWADGTVPSFSPSRACSRALDMSKTSKNVELSSGRYHQASFPRRPSRDRSDKTRLDMGTAISRSPTAVAFLGVAASDIRRLQGADSRPWGSGPSPSGRR
jgi:hypothetical protein